MTSKYAQDKKSSSIHSSTHKYARIVTGRCGNISGKSQRLLGFTLTDIARGSGTHVSQISRVFNCTRGLSLDRAARIAAYMGLTLDAFYSLLQRVRIAVKHGKPFYTVE